MCKLVNFSKIFIISLVASQATAQPSQNQPTTQISSSVPAAPKVSLRHLPFPQLKASLVEYSTRRIDDLKKEKICIENAQNNRELRSCVELIKSNHRSTTEAVNKLASKQP